MTKADNYLPEREEQSAAARSLVCKRMPFLKIAGRAVSNIQNCDSDGERFLHAVFQLSNFWDSMLACCSAEMEANWVRSRLSLMIGS